MASITIPCPYDGCTATATLAEPELDDLTADPTLAGHWFLTVCPDHQQPLVRRFILPRAEGARLLGYEPRESCPTCGSDRADCPETLREFPGAADFQDRAA